jgi:HlyD family secretion protein
MAFLGRRTVFVIIAVAFAGGGIIMYLGSSRGNTTVYRTAELKRGDLLATISATGTVEPEEVVDVGAQVAGKINSFGVDKNGKEIDYGSVVEESTVLAQIDDSLYTAEVAQASAQVMQAKASVQRAAADIEQMKAKLFQSQRDWERAQKLGPSEALAQSSFDAYKSGYEAAKANVEVGEAAIEQAKASVSQADAVLQRAQRNLGYCTIKSPVKGVIIDRRVNIGQTVVASLNAPSLFLIAKDLKRMEVWVAVNEADIGNIRPGQAVSFTIDAYPGEIFRGAVGKVRLNATMTQNVVTYTVEIVTDNSNGRLLPYLTANVLFELSHKENVLMVPNVALRWWPQTEQVASEFREVPLDLKVGNGNGNHKNGASSGKSDISTGSSYGVVWVPEGNYVRPVKVRVGISDGTMTEVEGDELREGLAVVTGEEIQSDGSSSTTTNPFTPQIIRPR